MECTNNLTLKEEVSQYIKRTFCNEEALSHNDISQCERLFESQLDLLTQPPMFSCLRMNPLHPYRHSIKEDTRAALHQQASERQQSECLDVQGLLQLPDVLVIPHTGPHNRQQCAKEVIVGIGCGMTVLRGADVYVQGILGAPASMHAGDVVSVYADVAGKCLRGLLKPFTGERLYVGNGIAKFSRDQIFASSEKISGVGILMTEPVYVAPSLMSLLPDRLFAQNLPSVVCGHLLTPQAGERILDMCAAPGGKTTHIAALMEDKGEVIAFDKSKSKIVKIMENAKNWGLTSIRAYYYDGIKAFDPAAEPDGDPPYPADTFDRILLDAPCSALGQRPALRNNMTLAEVKSFPVLQRKLFETAVKLLRPGGVLVYSTCTITLEENEMQVKWALDTFPELRLEKPEPCLGQPGFVGAGLRETERSCVQRFGTPAALQEKGPLSDTIGFFCVKFVKLK